MFSRTFIFTKTKKSNRVKSCKFLAPLKSNRVVFIESCHAYIINFG